MVRLFLTGRDRNSWKSYDAYNERVGNILNSAELKIKLRSTTITLAAMLTVDCSKLSPDDHPFQQKDKIRKLQDALVANGKRES